MPGETAMQNWREEEVYLHECMELLAVSCMLIRLSFYSCFSSLKLFHLQVHLGISPCGGLIECSVDDLLAHLYIQIIFSAFCIAFLNIFFVMCCIFFSVVPLSCCSALCSRAINGNIFMSLILFSDTMMRQAAMAVKCVLLMYYRNGRGHNFRRQVNLESSSRQLYTCNSLSCWRVF